MRYRTLAILAAVMAVIGLSAPAALAAPKPAAPASCTVGSFSGPYHIEPNSNTSLVISYHGQGNQVTVSSKDIGDSYLVVADCSGPYYLIQNAAGNCIRMHDASSGYTVYEEVGCEPANTEEQFFRAPGDGTGLYKFQDRHWGLWLATADCPAVNGDPVVGKTDAAGNCVNWDLDSA